MNPKTFLSKTLSVFASLALAIGGSLIATQPAGAAPLADAYLSATVGTASITMQWFECPEVSGTITSSDFTFSRNGTTESVTTSNFITILGVKTGVNLNLGANIATTDVLRVSYSASSTSMTCGASGSTVVVPAVTRSWSKTLTMNTAPAFTVSGTTASATDGIWSSGGSVISDISVNRWWVLCNSEVTTAANATPPNSCAAVKYSTTIGMYEKLRDFLVATTGNIMGTSADLTSKHLMLYVRVGDVQYTTPTTSVATILGLAQNNNQNNNSQSNNVTATVERSIQVPAFQAPILNSLAPKMTAGFSSNGGRLVLKDVKPADITSVLLNGKKVEVVASKSGAALRIPAGAGAGDLQFTMADGTVISVANAVKITQSQVDPKLVDLNNLPTFKAGSVAVPSTIKKALIKNKEIILDSASAKCVGYASSNTASARATALSRASNVCGVITDINENIEPIIKVLVNKTIAKKSPVKYQTW
jgi:hypothetical protein